MQKKMVTARKTLLRKRRIMSLKGSYKLKKEEKTPTILLLLFGSNNLPLSVTDLYPAFFHSIQTKDKS